MSYERRRIIGPSENRLSRPEAAVRIKFTLEVVEHACQYKPWSNLIDKTILFGSMACEEGYTNSDVDVAFKSNSRHIPNDENFLNLSVLLAQTVNRCREIHQVQFTINPFLVYESWPMGRSEYYHNPDVLEAIKEGIPIWSK